jgi:glycosyltransferase involved in cell wall biosynthesis
MSPTKGVVTLIRAMQVVWVGDPTVRLLLAGSGLPSTGRCDPEVSAAWDSLSPAERSRIAAIPSFREEEKASIFDALDVFAMVSTAESFGIAYLEAWMCGKAVIGSAIGSTECVIQDRVDGRLVPVDDSRELAACIIELLGDRAMRERMGRAGQARTRASFTWERVTDAVEHVYTATRTAAQPDRQPAGAIV